MGEPLPSAADRATKLSPEVEADLIRAAQANPDLFRPLYLQWVTPVYKYLLSRLHDLPEAEDLTSQVFLVACEQLPRYNHRGRFAAWLFTIARNKARDHHRTAGRSVSLDQVEPRGSDPDLLAQAIRSDEKQQPVGDAHGWERHPRGDGSAGAGNERRAVDRLWLAEREPDRWRWARVPIGVGETGELPGVPADDNSR